MVKAIYVILSRENLFNLRQFIGKIGYRIIFNMLGSCYAHKC